VRNNYASNLIINNEPSNTQLWRRSIITNQCQIYHSLSNNYIYQSFWRPNCHESPKHNTHSVDEKFFNFWPIY